MSNKPYKVTVNGSEVDTRSEKSSAIKLAQKLANEQKASVQVLTPAGNVVFMLSSMAKVPGGTGVRAKPYTRLEADSVSIVDESVLPAGYEVCYIRKRLNVAVIRQRGMAGLKVINASTGEVLAEASGTKEASDITTEMARKAREQRAAEKEAAKAAKAEATEAAQAPESGSQEQAA